MLTQKEIDVHRKIFSESDKTMTEAFKVLSDVNRYRIFRIMAQQPKLTVSNISKILDISLPLTSQHIKILVNAKLLHKQREGKKVFPKLEHKNPFVQAVVATIKHAKLSGLK